MKTIKEIKAISFQMKPLAKMSIICRKKSFKKKKSKTEKLTMILLQNILIRLAALLVHRYLFKTRSKIKSSSLNHLQLRG